MHNTASLPCPFPAAGVFLPDTRHSCAGEGGLEGEDGRERAFIGGAAGFRCPDRRVRRATELQLRGGSKAAACTVSPKTFWCAVKRHGSPTSIKLRYSGYFAAVLRQSRQQQGECVCTGGCVLLDARHRGGTSLYKVKSVLTKTRHNYIQNLLSFGPTFFLTSYKTKPVGWCPANRRWCGGDRQELLLAFRAG